MAAIPVQGGWMKRVPTLAEVGWGRRIQMLLRDGLWYIRHTPIIMISIVVVLVALFLIFAASYVIGGRIFPNVWVLNVHLGDLNEEQAANRLNDAWEKEMRIQLVDGDRAWTVQPAQIGMKLDAARTVQNARAIGMSGIPMGYNIPPIVSVDFTPAQTFLLDLTAKTDVPPFNAGYGWQDGQLVAVPGKNGRLLNVPSTIEQLMNDPVSAAQTGRLNLVMSPLEPQVANGKPFLDLARAAISKPFTLTGYDPFTNEIIQWSTTREVFVSWLEASEDGLIVRDSTFAPFLEAQNRSLNKSGDERRYLDGKETRASIAAAVNNKQNKAELRVRYRGLSYEVVPGDSGYRISRKTGIPFYLIQNVNAGRDLSKLSPGDTISLPSRDSILPEKPVPHKRIIVNLDTQALVAYENGKPVFNWLISSGMDKYPTSPGIYQILNHEEEASGGSYTLCDSAGCGSWVMYWFMGIYEVQPGLMNGFHGAVLLPDGTYLGGGNVGAPFTFGCIMSENGNAEQLYRWAEIGTIVEIVSSEFAPVSALGQLAWEQTGGIG
jgi:lipoprotein-anchoring transpeptidase ErfK/SrfK